MSRLKIPRRTHFMCLRGLWGAFGMQPFPRVAKYLPPVPFVLLLLLLLILLPVTNASLQDQQICNPQRQRCQFMDGF